MKRPPLYAQILIAMAAGAAIGLSLNAAVVQGALPRETVLQIAGFGEKAGHLFLALLNMVVVPLIFSSLISAITGLAKTGGNLKRLGIRTVGYYLLTSFIAIFIGIVVVNLVRPGDGMDYDLLMQAAQSEMTTLGKTAPDVAETAAAGAFGVLGDIVFRMVPPNVIEASTSNRAILSVIFFAVCFGASAVATGGEALDTVDRMARAVFDVMITLTNGVLVVAPLGIFGYVLFVTASTGLSLVGALLWYMLAVAIALAIHAFIVLPALLFGFTGRNPLQYAFAMKDALLTAFSTASSSGTLPLTMQCASGPGGIPHRVTSFTLPLGATVNMDGTALYEAVAVLFVAQMRGDLDLSQQLVVAFTALLASVGAAGIPHAGTVMMVIVMGAVGLPTEAVLVILAVDRVLDMARTSVNVWSDSVGAAIVAHFEPETLKHLFVMDPLEKIRVAGDSTYVTMRECCDRGHSVHMCTPDQLYSFNGEARALATPVRVTAEAPHFSASPRVEQPLQAWDIVWMRKDPPFDMDYIFTTYLLDMAGTLVVNASAGLKLFNEKLWVQQQWPEHQPDTLITSSIERTVAFVDQVETRTVLKPWDGNGGRGVLITQKGDANLRSMVEMLTNEGRAYLIAQRYLPGVVDGDKRVLLFDGEVVGAMARVPQASDHRANMHAGASVARTELTEGELAVCAAIGPELKRHGQVFVGIDLIDEKLTEINVTSPTGIQEINRLYGLKLEADLVDSVLRRKGEQP